MKARVGLIGFGRFGRLAARCLSREFRVAVYDPAAAPAEIASLGAEAVDLAQAAAAEAVILAVPISAMEPVLGAIAPRLSPGTLVADVCSVKEEPIRWMEALLPASVDILGTHPLFGPDSAADSLAGLKIVLCPVRIGRRRLAAVAAGLAARGLVVVETTAEEHDRQAAFSLGLTHWIGRALAEIGARRLAIDTENYRRLLAVQEIVSRDNLQLFEEMHRFNRFAPEARRILMAALERLDSRLR